MKNKKSRSLLRSSFDKLFEFWPHLSTHSYDLNNLRKSFCQEEKAMVTLKSYRCSSLTNSRRRFNSTTFKKTYCDSYFGKVQFSKSLPVEKFATLKPSLNAKIKMEKKRLKNPNKTLANLKKIQRGSHLTGNSQSTLKEFFKQTSIFGRKQEEGLSHKTPKQASQRSFKQIQKGSFIGRHLPELCQSNNIPRPVLMLLQELLNRGPKEVGIFRKSANARVVRKLKEKLDRGEEIFDIGNISINAITSLLKYFLSSLPDCLLCKYLYEDWLEVSLLSTFQQRKEKICNLCFQLPSINVSLLVALLYILNRISAHSQSNMMTSLNLAICVGPSILWSSTPDINFDLKILETISFMIDNVVPIFGKEETFSALASISLFPLAASSKESDKKFLQNRVQSPFRWKALISRKNTF